MLLEPLDLLKEILSCSGSKMSRKNAIRADRLDLTLPWQPQESAAMGCSHRQIWAAGMGAPTGTACRLAVQYPDTILITTERQKRSEDLWGRAENLLLRGSKGSWGSCENNRLCEQSVPVACILLPLSPYDLAFSAPFLYSYVHTCISLLENTAHALLNRIIASYTHIQPIVYFSADDVTLVTLWYSFSLSLFFCKQVPSLKHRCFIGRIS